MTNILIFTVCGILFIIFLVVRREDILYKSAKLSVGRLDSAWQGTERRQYPRILVNLPVPYQYADEPGPLKQAKTHDIARGGIGLIIHEKLTQGDHLKLHFAQEKNKIFVTGVVVGCQEIKPENAKRLFRVGIRFLNLSESQWKKIQASIIKKPVTHHHLLSLAVAFCLTFAPAVTTTSWAAYGDNKDRGPASKTRQNIKQRRAIEKQRAKETEAAYERELHEYARQRKNREARLKEAGWLEKAEAHYARQDFEEAYQLYRLLLGPTVDRPLREKAKERIKELEDNQILGKIIHEEKKAEALKDLNSSDQIIRLEALKQLGELGDSSVSSEVVIALKDSDPFIRRVAAWSLGQIGDLSGVAPLIDALGDEEKWIRQEARSALERITGQDFGYNIEDWVHWWRSKES